MPDIGGTKSLSFKTYKRRAHFVFQNKLIPLRKRILHIYITMSPNHHRVTIIGSGPAGKLCVCL